MSNDLSPSKESNIHSKIYPAIYSSILLIAILFNGCTSEILSISLISHTKYLNASLLDVAAAVCFKYIGGMVGYLVVAPFISYREKTFVKDIVIAIGIIGNFITCLIMSMCLTNWTYLTLNFLFQGISSSLIIYYVNRVFVPLLKSKSILLFQVQSLVQVGGGFITILIAKCFIAESSLTITFIEYLPRPTDIIALDKLYFTISMMNLAILVIMLFMMVWNICYHYGDYDVDDLINSAQEENEKKIHEGSRSPVTPSSITGKISKIYALYRPSFHILGFIFTYFLVFFISEQILYRYFYIFISQLDFKLSPQDCFIIMIFFWVTIFMGRLIGLCVTNKEFLRIITIILKVLLFATAIAMNFVDYEPLPLLLLAVIMLFMHGFCLLGLMTEVSGFSSYNLYYLLVICFTRELSGLIQIYPMAILIARNLLAYLFVPVAVMYGVSALIYYGFCYYAYKNRTQL